MAKTNSTQRHGRTSQRRPRTPGALYTAVSAVFAVLITAVALTSRQSAPPTIAEFAPQAVEQVLGSSADGSAGSRGEAVDASTSEESAIADAAGSAVDVARVRSCVGDPPRQIEDPQSPPCVPYWSGDNGGATSHGVTRDEIRVVSMNNQAEDAALAAFFNKRFEFYGRRVRVIPITVPRYDVAGERAAAQAAYTEHKAFGSLQFVTGFKDYFAELARVGIVAVDQHPQYPERFLADRHPYLWTYAMANDRLFAMTGNWYCARFAGRNAVHAGDPVLRMTRRKAGIILTQTRIESTSAEPMNDQLASCAEPRAQIVQTANENVNLDPVFLENAVLQMKTSGVTTVACFCETFEYGLFARAATNQGYFPEWLLTSYIGNDDGEFKFWSGMPAEQLNVMGLTVRPMQRPAADHPSNWATRESANTQSASGALYQAYWDNQYRYWLLFASGLQMAGPRLTPTTFAQGLQGTRFPNPAHPLMAGAVGFEDDHSMTDDAAEFWWSKTAPSPYPEDGPGFYCYVDHGARRRIGKFPADDPFFASGPCDSGTTAA